MDLWFGDSWPAGHGLDQPSHIKQYADDTYPKVLDWAKVFLPIDRFNDDSILSRYRFITHDTNPEIAFPTLVSNARGKSFSSFAIPGASIDYQLYCMLQFFKNEYVSGKEYEVFVCTTRPDRYFFLDVLGQAQHGHFTDELDIDRLSTRQLDDTDSGPVWNAATSLYRATLALNQMYLLCQNHGVPMHIVDVWTHVETDNISIVPETIYLMGNYANLPSIPYPYQEYTFVSEEQMVHLMSASREEFKELCVGPDNHHPTEFGHQVIAQNILWQLNKEINNNDE